MAFEIFPILVLVLFGLSSLVAMVTWFTLLIYIYRKDSKIFKKLFPIYGFKFLWDKKDYGDPHIAKLKKITKYSFIFALGIVGITVIVVLLIVGILLILPK